MCFLVSSSRHELHIPDTFTSTPTTNSAFHVTIPICETTSGNLASGFFPAWCATGHPSRSSSWFSASWSRASSWVWVFHAGMQRKHVRKKQFVGALRAPSPSAHTEYDTAAEEWQTKPPWAWAVQKHWARNRGGNSGCDERLHFTISATWPDDVTCDILFLVCATSKRICLDPPVLRCLNHLAHGPRGLRLKLC